MSPDPRLVVGNVVLAKAMHVTNESECGRRYGREKKTKMLEGTVLLVTITRSETTKRCATTILANYHLGGGTYKEKALLVRNIRTITPPLPVAAVAEDTSTAAAPTLQNIENEVAALLLEETAEEQATTQPNIRPPIAPTVPVLVQVLNNNNTTTPTHQVTIAPAITTTGPSPTLETPPPMQQLPVVVPATNKTTPVVTVHEQEWFSDRNASLRDINGTYHRRQWYMRNVVGDHLTTGHNVDKMMSRLDIFLLMFPPDHLLTIVNLTNIQLKEAMEKPTTIGEIVKFLGLILLITRFEFNSRSDLWCKKPWAKYVPAPDLGRTGMSRKRFDILWRYIRWSDQPEQRPLDMSSEQYRWLLVDDFLKSFNEYRASTFSPSETICVDESMSRWYGQGGEWINHGLPMYVAIDRKPENGCEIQSACCGVCGIMIQLKLVKTATEQERIQHEGNINDLTNLHGLKVLKELIHPWMYTERLVCADSYFSSFAAAEDLLRHKMRFIGVVKTATKRFPMSYLTSVELSNRGDRVGLVANDADGVPKYLSFVYMDRERRYFIATGSSLDEGTPISRKRWRQVDLSDNADPERLLLTIPQPKAAATYYNVCGRVDQHNRDRQDTLMIERKLKTHDWSQRVNLSIFAMILVDTFRLYSKMTYPPDEEAPGEVQKTFYTHLATEMIDNRLDIFGRSARQHAARTGRLDEDDENFVLNRRTGAPRCGASAHITPTKRFRVTASGVVTKTRFQGHCRACDAKTTHQCSICVDSIEIDDPGWICSAKDGKMCFSEHLGRTHNEYSEYY